MRIIAGLQERLPRGGLLRAAVTLVAGTGVGQLIVIVSSPIVTRLYTPADYGVYSVAVSILVVSVVTCLRYEFAIPLPEDDLTAANLLALSLLANVAMSIAMALVLLAFGPWLLAQLGASVLAPYIVLVALAQAGSGLVSALTNWAVRTKEFGEIAANRLYQSAALVVVQVGLGIAALGAPGLLLGTVAGSLAGSLRLARAAWRTHAATFTRVTWAAIAQAAHRYRRFPIFSSWSALLAQLGVRAPFLLFIAFYGPEVGGIYAFAERLCYLPITLVAGSVGQVFIAEGARLLPDRPDELRALFGRTTRALAKVAIGPTAAIAIAAPFLTGPVFGSPWTEAGVFVAILAPMFFFAFVLTSTGDVLYLVERQGLQLVREVFRITLLGGSVLVAGLAHLGAREAVALLSVAGSVTYLAYGVISARAIDGYRPRT